MMWAMTAGKDPVALKRLATLVTQRRLELGMDKIDVARAADLTITTYGKIERGESVRDTSYGKLEPALGWAPRSCIDVLGGADRPTLITGHLGPAATSPVFSEDLAEEIGDVVQNAAIHVSDTMTAPDVRALKAEVIELLRKRGILPARQES
jgi:transcriptional regulator with XRE-family HTH domain